MLWRGLHFHNPRPISFFNNISSHCLFLKRKSVPSFLFIGYSRILAGMCAWRMEDQPIERGNGKYGNKFAATIPSPPSPSFSPSRSMCLLLCNKKLCGNSFPVRLLSGPKKKIYVLERSFVFFLSWKLKIGTVSNGFAGRAIFYLKLPHRLSTWTLIFGRLELLFNEYWGIHPMLSNKIFTVGL